MPGRASRIARQNEALVEIAKQKVSSTLTFEEEVRSITEVVANTLRVERVGIWFYEQQGHSLKNIVLYERSRKKHSKQSPIRAIDFPQYFRAIEESRGPSSGKPNLAITANEIIDDGYLLPRGISSMLDAPIFSKSEVIGILCVESHGRRRTWSSDERDFTQLVADYLSGSFDSWERVRSKEELQYRVEFEKLLLSVANRFINVPAQDIKAVVDEALQTIGEFVGVDRCYTYRFDSNGETMSNTNEWVAAGADHKIFERQHLPLSSFSWAVAHIKRGEPVSIPSIDVIPLDAPDRERFTYFGVRSLVWVPLIQDDYPMGFVGFTCTKTSRQWTLENIALLKLVAETLVNLFSKEEALKEKERAQEERRKLELEMQKAQKLESLGLMAGGVAHDFNNLLLSILGNSSLLLHELSPGTKAYERAGQIKQTAERAAELTNQLLTFSGRRQFSAQTVRSNEIITEMMTMLHPVLSPKARVSLNLGEDLPPLRADATQLRQVLMNLIKNASDALEGKEGEITVTSSEIFLSRAEISNFELAENLKEGRYVAIDISDTGCGMSKETVSKIFEPFFSTKFTGRGLGLAAVHGILRGHGGGIRIKSELGKGTTFQVLFPTLDSSHTSLPLEQTGIQQTSAVQQGLPLSGPILLIDDDELSRTVVEQMLEQLGLHVLAVDCGETGIEIVKTRGSELSLVLVDLTMPGLDGSQTATAINLVAPALPIVLMSGYSETEASLNLEAGTAFAFLQKPFTLASLLELFSKLRPE